ncbi:MAG: PASTA domain-containing protein [Bacteroidetes bacterium]|nr:MAG: PASTA domain-containing protein [Bacteroidota bacterium]
MSNLVKFLKSKVFFINVLIAFLLCILSIYLVYAWMGKITHHGESIAVPNLRGMDLAELDTFLAEKSLKFQVVDSLFDGSKPGGTILEQDPAPESNVKEGRTIYLTVNSASPPKVKMPNLIDVSYRQAEAILQTFGLKVGQLSYEPDLAKNAVLEQHYKGSTIKPGVEIFKGSKIDLVLGDGLGTTEVSVPMLIGLTKSEAMFVLKGSGLILGEVFFDPNTKDEEEALIYKQDPESGVSSNMNQGDAIDIYLR